MGRLQTDMDLSAGWIAVIAGTISGIISGFGVGGGSLLMVWMTAVIAINQKTAQGINLLYFLPTSVAALIFHIKNKQICWRVVIPAAICGCLTAILSAWAAASIDVKTLRTLFGCFLLIIGLSELFKKTPQK